MSKKICAVYKIVNKVTNDCYIGSSVNVKKRWKEHKMPSVHKRYPNSRMYQDMDELGVGSFELEVICECDKKELHDKEQFYIELEQPEYNHNRATGQNTERRKAWQKAWRQSEKGKAYLQSEKRKTYLKAYDSQICNYNNEILSLEALASRFQRKGIPHPYIEARKFLITSIPSEESANVS